MFSFRAPLVGSAVLVASAMLAACSADSSTAPSAQPAVASAAAPSILATVRVRCELRVAGPVSRISVDGNNLSPLNAMWKAGIRSGGTSIGAPAQQAVGDQAEFDFSSDPGDIARGATPIPANFIKINASGPDVFGAILDLNGNRVAVGSADCRIR